MLFILVFISAFVLSLSLTPLIRRLALKYQILDYPNSERKIHLRPTPLLGGGAIFLSFTVVSLAVAWLTDWVVGKDISWCALIAIILGGLIIMVGGYFDDKYNLKPARQIIAPLLAVLVVVLLGLGPKVISSPWGGVINLDFWSVTINWLGLNYSLSLISGAVALIWLLGMMYTTKLMDGLDGLVTGLGVIGSLIIFGLTQFTPFYQTSVGILALILAGSTLGFLVWNFQPAKIFLGEGGSLFIGFMLGVLAIISGAKIATALLIMGLPILDMIWVITKRLLLDNKPISQADTNHLHHRLLALGWSPRQVVLLLYFFSLVFGLSALFLNTIGKIIALGVAGVVIIFMIFWFYRKST